MNEPIYKQRRSKLLEMMDDGVAIITTAQLQTRSNDTEYPFRPNSDFYYLTGFDEDNSTLVLFKKEGVLSTTLFVQKKEPELELWSGIRLGVEAAQERFSVDDIFESEALITELKRLMKDQDRLYIDLFSEEKLYGEIKKVAASLLHDRSVNRAPRSFHDITALTQKMRLIKDDFEIIKMREALAITASAHHHAMILVHPNMMEYQLQAEYEYIFKKEGAYSDAYTTIIAGGNNANTLHYIKNDQPLKSGDLVLVDAGCEYEMYASDITRTYPVDGKFTPAQIELYNMVLEVQLQIFELIKVGSSKKILQEHSERLLCEGMVALGILKGDVKTLLKEKKQKKYYPHGIGHWIGLDVHDPLPYKDENGDDMLFEAGMVLTIEPGIYLPEDDRDVPKKYRGIGIRIEDNILVTPEGYENLSSHIAKTVQEIEARCS